MTKILDASISLRNIPYGGKSQRGQNDMYIVHSVRELTINATTIDLNHHLHGNAGMAKTFLQLARKFFWFY